MRLQMAETPRTCGPCTLCCKVLAVRELGKPKDTWCPHARKGAGCGIYWMRPEPCRDFRCFWLQGLLPEPFRPDKVHGVVYSTRDGANVAIHEDPGYAGQARHALRPFLEPFVADGQHMVVVVCGEHRHLFAAGEALEKARRTVETAKAEQ